MRGAARKPGIDPIVLPVYPDRPRVGSTRRLIILRSVVLPEPEVDDDGDRMRRDRQRHVAHDRRNPA